MSPHAKGDYASRRSVTCGHVWRANGRGCFDFGDTHLCARRDCDGNHRCVCEAM